MAAALRGAAAICVLAAASGSAAAPAAAAPASKHSVCRLGAYLSDLYNLDPANSTFTARVWLWSLCARKEDDPLATASFSNASSYTVSSSATTREAGRYRHLQLVVGTFRQEFNERDYPFDRQQLQILVTAGLPIQQFRFLPDAVNSSAREDITVPGWKIEGFRENVVEQRYVTNFGDRTLPPREGSTYSRMRLRISIARADPITFVKTIGPLYIIFLVTVLTFLVTTITPETFRGRLATLGATLFAVIVNMQRADGVVATGGVTLLNQLHILTLLWILFAMGATFIAWRWTERDVHTARVKRLNHASIVYGSIVYVALTTILLAIAAA